MRRLHPSGQMQMQFDDPPLLPYPVPPGPPPAYCAHYRCLSKYLRARDAVIEHLVAEAGRREAAEEASQARQAALKKQLEGTQARTAALQAHAAGLQTHALGLHAQQEATRAELAAMRRRWGNM